MAADGRPGAARGPIGSPLYRPAALLVAGAMAAFTAATNRLRTYGRVPRGARSLLVVSNHVHDLDGAIIPPRLFLADPLRARVRAAGAQRLFEPGHVARIAPAWIRRFLHAFNVGPAIAFLGALPIESDPRYRVLRSLAWEILRNHGDLRWSDVLEETRLAVLAAKASLAGRELRELRVRDAFRPRLGPIAEEPVPVADLRSPFREEVRRATRPRVQAQLARIEAALAAGDTVYITPEGRLTPDGRVLRLREIVDRLLPHAAAVTLAALAYDVFTPGRLGIHLRWTEPADPARLGLSLAAARPVTASQVVAAALISLGGVASEEAWITACERLARSLPENAFAVPDLRGEVFKRAVRAMAARGFVERAEGAAYRRRAGARDPRFPHVADMVAYQAAMFEQTVEACRALA